MTTINVVVQTKAQTFPAGTVDGVFTFKLSGVGVELSIDSATPVAAFPDVTAGTYTVSVTKLGVSASAEVVVPEADVSLQVPNAITVTLA